jgi:hypothetical protein
MTFHSNSPQLHTQLHRSIERPLLKQLDETLPIPFWLELRDQLAHPPRNLHDSQLSTQLLTLLSTHPLK